MKAAVVTHDHQVNVTEKTLRPLEYGEALLKMECCGVCHTCLLYTSPSPRDSERSRMPSSA